MTSLFARQIIQDLNKDIKRAAPKAAAAWVEAVREHPAVPYKLGDLRDGITVQSVTGNKTTIIKIVSTTTNNGFDYPSYLDKYNKKHKGWWDKVTNQRTAEKALDALVRSL